MKERRGLMTSGPVAKQIFSFAVPLLLGNLFQQLYNAVDSAVVGHFVGNQALAAVGSSASIINLVVNLFMGVAIGGSVIVSQYYGARRKQELHDAVHTIMAFSLLAGVVMTIFGVILSPWILRWMGTLEDVMQYSVTYFRIFFGGILSTVIYNMGSGLLRAVGDSKRPLYFLIFASILNIGLDVLFVAVFHWGVAGVAIATIAAQAVSSVLVLYVLIQSDEEYRLIIKDIRIHKKELGYVIRLGVPSGIQNAVIAFSNVIVQKSINVFGSAAMAGVGAYFKIDGFAVLPVISFSMSMTTFIGQNMGAREYERVKAGRKAGTLMGAGTILGITILLQFLGTYMLRIFTDDPEVIQYGIQAMWTLSLGYVLLAYSQVTAGVLRGAGLTSVPMVVMILCWCGIRMLWVSLVGVRLDSLNLVLGGYPVSWLFSSLILAVYIRKVDWIHYSEKHMR